MDLRRLRRPPNPGSDLPSEDSPFRTPHPASSPFVSFLLPGTAQSNFLLAASTTFRYRHPSMIERLPVFLSSLRALLRANRPRTLFVIALLLGSLFHFTSTAPPHPSSILHSPLRRSTTPTSADAPDHDIVSSNNPSFRPLSPTAAPKQIGPGSRPYTYDAPSHSLTSKDIHPAQHPPLQALILSTLLLTPPSRKSKKGSGKSF